MECLIDQGQSLRQELERQQDVEEEEGTGQGVDPVVRLLRWGGAGHRLHFPAGRAACDNLLRASASARGLPRVNGIPVPQLLNSLSGCHASGECPGKPPSLGGQLNKRNRCMPRCRQYAAGEVSLAELQRSARELATEAVELEEESKREEARACRLAQEGQRLLGGLAVPWQGWYSVLCGWVGEAWGVRGRDVACWWEGAFGRLHMLRV